MAAADTPGQKRVVAVVGHFAFDSGRINGQIYRTRLVAEELQCRLESTDVRSVDTGWLQQRPLRTLRAVWKAAASADDLIMMPGERGLQWLTPIFLWWHRRRSLRLHYFVVGGWLPQFLRRKPALLKRLQACEGVYVQTQRMLGELQSLGMTNLFLMPNFRRFPLPVQPAPDLPGPLRLVLLSRLTPDKGVHLAIAAVKKINAEGNDTQVTLDIFGPIRKSEEGWFAKVMAEACPVTRYLGVLAPDEINATLRSYDALVFPTSYSGEGFPGVLIDAMAAGITVIASDWKDNSEIVRHGKNGLLFEPRNQEDLETRLRVLIGNRELIRRLKHESAGQAGSFHVDRIFPEVLAAMGLLVK